MQNIYQISILQTNSNIPYIPMEYVIHMDVWKNYLLPLLTDIGFQYIGNLQVSGTEQHLIEFLLTYQIPSTTKGYNMTIDKVYPK